MPAQCTRPCGTRIARPSTLRVPGAITATGAPPVHALLVPVVLDVVDRVQRLVAEHAGEAREHRPAPRRGRAQPVVAPGAAADEREQNAARGVRWAVVERHADGAAVVEPEAVEPGVAPERRPVHRVALHQLAHLHALEELLPSHRQSRAERRCPAPAAAGTRRSPGVALTTPRVVVTVTPVLVWEIRVTAAPSATRSPRSFASRVGIRPEPPTKRRLLRAVRGVGVALEGADVALVTGARDVPEHEQQAELAAVGTEAGLGPAQDQVDHAPCSPSCRCSHCSNVMASHSTAFGWFHGAATSISAAMSSICFWSFAASGRIVGSGGTVPS